jgi:hypothetical protein
MRAQMTVGFAAESMSVMAGLAPVTERITARAVE